MRILAIVQGEFGKRKVENIKKFMPAGWSMEMRELPRRLPLVIDDAEQFLPKQITDADLLLALGESPAAAQLIPELAKFVRAKAVIAPVDDHDWLPEGMKTQLKMYVAEFARYFGKPELKIKVEEGKIKEVTVLRDTPVVAQQYHHQYPCLASSIKERHVHDNLMNRAGRLLEVAIKKELKST